MGAPVVEHPKEGQIFRAYPISRVDPELDDLEISQCLFAGNEAVKLNFDETSKLFLHPMVGTFGADKGVGLFKNEATIAVMSILPGDFQVGEVAFSAYFHP
ncbi:hypothetical protein A6C57_25915 [Fibrella sp. ES10-3-2-2]